MAALLVSACSKKDIKSKVAVSVVLIEVNEAWKQKLSIMATISGV